MNETPQSSNKPLLFGLLALFLFGGGGAAYLYINNKPKPKTVPLASVDATTKPTESKPEPKPSYEPHPLLASYKPSHLQYERGPEQKGMVALTFDGGSDATAVPIILKYLKERDAKATFFLTGKFCELFPKESKMIADAGMELGNHSYSHPHFTKLSDAQIKQQLEKAEKAIIKACGRGSKPLFRFPYGDANERVCKAVAAAGYQAIYWTLDSHDSVGKTKTSDFVATRITKKLGKGYITLQHVSEVGSAKALPAIFEKMDELELKPVFVSELLLDKQIEMERIAAKGSEETNPTASPVSLTEQKEEVTATAKNPSKEPKGSSKP